MALCAVAAALMATASCQVTPSSTHGATAAPTTVPAAPTLAASPSASAGLLGCPSAQPLSSLPVLAHTDISPDDLLAFPNGTLWVTDPDSGHIEHLGADGLLLQRISDPQAPEGMVAVGGYIVLAEQRTNRLVLFTPPDAARTALLTLPTRAGAEGVDGIGIDAAGGRLLLPDSPQGVLLSSSTNGTNQRVLASGLGRDVAATIGPDGSVWVAVEGARGLWHVPSGGGAATAVGGGDLTQLDDIVTVGSLLYATSLTTNDVVAIDPLTGADRVLVTGGHSLQGLALLSDGRLAVADSTSRLIATVATC